MMHVAHISRRSVFTDPGGDTYQMQATARELEPMGVACSLHGAGEQVDLTQYDVVHLYNLTTVADLLPYAEQAKLLGKPMVLSTIFVDYEAYDRQHRPGLSGQVLRRLSADQGYYVKTLAKYAKAGLLPPRQYVMKGHRWGAKRLLSLAAHLLPNSQSERDRVRAVYGAGPPATMVPNGVDSSLFEVEADAAYAQFKGSALCVGRLEGRKNQLALVKAVRAFPGMKLYLVGAPAENQPAYVEQLRAAAGPNVHLLGHRPRAEVVAMLKQAALHVLPSYFETTGLSSLEAGALGCRLVVSRTGDQEAYFEGMAAFCQPDDSESIVHAMREALAFSDAHVQAQQARIRQQYTWQRAAEVTLGVYKQLLAQA